MTNEFKYDFRHNDYTLDNGCLCSTERVRTWLEMEYAANPRFIPRGSDFGKFTDFCLTEAADHQTEFADMLWEAIEERTVYTCRLADAIAELVDDVICDFVNDCIDKYYGTED